MLKTRKRYIYVLIATLVACIAALLCINLTTSANAEEEDHGVHNDWNELLEDGGTLSESKYFLTKDITLKNNITINSEVTLCLNGNKLTGNGEGSVITISGSGSLTLCDCQDGKTKNTVNDIEYESGVITGGSTKYGGGVYINGGKFTMTGGTIAGNDVTLHGGGVYVGGTFLMIDGTIAGNTATSHGGGVFVNSGTFTMNGGNISGNTANKGGGVHVYINNAAFDMYGGTISGNTAANGGGVFVNGNAIFTLFYGDISGNSASNDGGGVYVSNYTSTGTLYQGTFKMSDGTISDNHADNKGGGGVFVASNATFEMSGGEISDNSAKDGGGVNVAYDDNGYGTFTLTGGVISENDASSLGGGVYVDSGAMFTMEDGQISKNKGSYGGGVYINSGTFDMEGGEISENTGDNGSGVYVYNGTFTMSDGYFDGVFSKNGSGSITIYSGTLTENVSGTYLAEDCICAAEADGTYSVGSPIVTIGETSYPTISSALYAAQNNETEIKLAVDVTESITVAEGQIIILDLNGFTLTNTDGKHTITNEGTLTIIDTGEGGTVTNVTRSYSSVVNQRGATAYLCGGIYTRDSEIDNNYSYVIKNNGVMEIESVVVENNSADYSSLIINSFPVNNVYYQEEPAQLTIYSGSFYSQNSNVVKNDEYGVLTIYGGTFRTDNGTVNSENAAILNWATATIYDGTFIGIQEAIVVRVYENQINTTIIYGGSFVGTYYAVFIANGYAGCEDGTINLTISGGTFTGIVGESLSFPVKNTDTIAIYGGVFSDESAASYFADNYGYEYDYASGCYTVIFIGAAIVNAQANVREYMATNGWNWAYINSLADGDGSSALTEEIQGVIDAYNAISAAVSEYGAACARLAAVEAVDALVSAFNALKSSALDELYGLAEEYGITIPTSIYLAINSASNEEELASCLENAIAEVGQMQTSIDEAQAGVLCIVIMFAIIVVLLVVFVAVYIPLISSRRTVEKIKR